MDTETSGTKPDSVTIKTDIKFSEIDFVRVNNANNTKPKLNKENQNQDEAINRHPALIRSTQRSKSADLISESSTKKTILKIKNQIYQETGRIGHEHIEKATKMNTYLNSQIIHHKNDPSFEAELTKSQIIKTQVARKKSENNEPQQNTAIATVTPKIKMYQQNNKNVNELNFEAVSKNVIVNQPKHSSRSSNTYAKCHSRQNPKKSFSPPPPVFISPNGLIAPPPPQVQIKNHPQNYVSRKQQELTYLQPINQNAVNNLNKKINFNELRNKFEKEKNHTLQKQRIQAQTRNNHQCNYQHQIMNNYKNNQINCSNYNHLNFKLNGTLNI